MAKEAAAGRGRPAGGNTILALLPAACSLAALGLVLGNVAAGVPPQADEGMAAHLFQILIAAQPPMVLMFAATADWKRPARPLCVLMAQAFAGAAALGALYWSGY